MRNQILIVKKDLEDRKCKIMKICLNQNKFLEDNQINFRVKKMIMVLLVNMKWMIIRKKE